MEDTQRERERVREYKLVIIRDITTITITIATTLTKAYKVTLYSDCLRATSLYNIYRNVLNLGCPRDNVNTTIIHLYSTLVRRTSDCGWGELDSDKAREFFAKHGVRLTLTTTYNPEANGKIERGHSPIIKALAKACNRRVKDWP